MRNRTHHHSTQARPILLMLNPLEDVSAEALQASNSVTTGLLMSLCERDDWALYDLPLVTRNLMWLHGTRPPAMVHLVPFRADAHSEFGKVALTSGYTYMRTELHGNYVYRRSESRPCLEINFRYCGTLNEQFEVNHVLYPTTRKFVWSYQTTRRGITAHPVHNQDAWDFMERNDRARNLYAGTMLAAHVVVGVSDVPNDSAGSTESGFVHVNL